MLYSSTKIASASDTLSWVARCSAMAESLQIAGKNIRQLAASRRGKALRYWSGAACIPLAFWISIQYFHLPLPWYLVFGALPLILLGQEQWRQAARADQGARAEEEVGQLLKQLPAAWRVEFNLKDPAVGDIDAVVIAPNGQAWALDTKSHAGEVRTDGQRLYRQFGSHRREFEKDLLKSVRKQAAVVCKRFQLRWVEPVLVFTRASITIRERKVEGVWVLTASELLEVLLDR